MYPICSYLVFLKSWGIPSRHLQLVKQVTRRHGHPWGLDDDWGAPMTEGKPPNDTYCRILIYILYAMINDYIILYNPYNDYSNHIQSFSVPLTISSPYGSPRGPRYQVQRPWLQAPHAPSARSPKIVSSFSLCLWFMMLMMLIMIWYVLCHLMWSFSQEYEYIWNEDQAKEKLQGRYQQGEQIPHFSWFSYRYSLTWKKKYSISFSKSHKSVTNNLQQAQPHLQFFFGDHVILLEIDP